jgi:hypothetical protein
MWLVKTAGRLLRTAANGLALVAFFLEGDADPLELPDNDDGFGPPDTPVGPVGPVTLSDEARRMVADGQATEPTTRPPRPITGGVFDLFERPATDDERAALKLPTREELLDALDEGTRHRQAAMGLRVDRRVVRRS